MCSHSSCIFFFFNDPATTEIYTLSLHDALPIFDGSCCSAYSFSQRQATSERRAAHRERRSPPRGWLASVRSTTAMRSEEHTSELQSHHDLVCRLLLEKKKKNR